jgi:hypothetical protein
MPTKYADGNIVELGDFASLWILSDGADTAEAVNASNISNILPRFVPGKEFKKTLNNTDFEKASS